MIKIENFVVVTFVTTGTPYELLAAQYLIPSLDKLNIPYYLEALDSRGSWLQNVALKPQTICNALYKFPATNIIFIDADAEVLQYPHLFNNIPDEYDCACHYLDWETWYKNGIKKKELLSGTVFLRNNDKIKELVKTWYVQATSSLDWEQRVLEKLLSDRPEIKVYPLPLDYCYIETLPDGSKPHQYIEHPTVLHHQASRKLKRRIH